MEVQHEYGEGYFHSAAQERARAMAEADAAETSGQGGIVPACTSVLQASRQVSNARGEIQIAGLIGAVCSHGIPVRDGFIAMPTPENHYLHEKLLRQLLPLLPSLDVIYLDIACQFANRFKNLKASLQAQLAIPPRGDGVQMLLPWMHARDHNLACQLKFSAMYMPSVGRKVGEQMEQFWADLKPIFALTRYMTWAHYCDALNLAMEGVMLGKQERFVELMVKRTASVFLAVEESEKEMAKLAEEAKQEGVNDLVAAREETIRYEESLARRPLSIEAQYVETTLLLQGHRTFSENRVSLAMSLPEQSSARVAARFSDDNRKLKLELKLNQLSSQLGIPGGQRWTETESRFVEGRKELGEALAMHVEEVIEGQVFKRQLIKKEKELSSGRLATRLKKRMTTIAADIRRLLDLRADYKQLALGSPLVAVNVDEVLKGNFPWADCDVRSSSSSRIATEPSAAPAISPSNPGMTVASNLTLGGSAPVHPGGAAAAIDADTAAGGNTATEGAPGSSSPPRATAIRHFGRRFRACAANKARTIEELSFLVKEVVRVLNWAEERVQTATNRLESLSTAGVREAHVARTGLARADPGLESVTGTTGPGGEIAMWKREKAKAELFLKQANEKLRPKLNKLEEELARTNT